jgi:hypothetical protein
MKGQWKLSWRAAAVLLAASLTGIAQTNTAQSQRTASPGTVNYIEGDVTLNGSPITNPTGGSAVVGPNQEIATGNGYAEVLLSPGAFLRLGHNSEVRMISAGLADVRLQLEGGSALVETADPVKGSTLDVTVDGAVAQIEKGGLYAFDANSQSVRVLDGKAQVRQNDKETTLKKGDEVLLTSNNPLKRQDFSVKSAETDPLYVWSKVRSQEEAQANVHAANLIVTGGGWYGPGWYWDPFWSGYAFLPGAGFWTSPFGWGFYSPVYFYGHPYLGWRGYYGLAYRPGYVARPGYVRPGYVGGVRTQVHAFGGGFHGGRR